MSKAMSKLYPVFLKSKSGCLKTLKKVSFEIKKSVNFHTIGPDPPLPSPKKCGT